ncbi:hypothetical protein TgHK011_006925 [Trichoderma gracile]|nr:hypothetical protein TgHK011_006925 [Trichoderma gracile]
MERQHFLARQQQEGLVLHQIPFLEQQNRHEVTLHDGGQHLYRPCSKETRPDQTRYRHLAAAAKEFQGIEASQPVTVGSNENQTRTPSGLYVCICLAIILFAF